MGTRSDPARTSSSWRGSGAGGARREKSVVREYVEAALWALALTLFLRAFVIQAFRIPTQSMENTLLIGDFLFVNKFEYGPKIPFTHIRFPGIRKPRPGDVIVFQYPQDPSKDYIKRCVAVGGQTVEMRDKDLYVDGRRTVEPYVIHSRPDTIPAGYERRDNHPPFTVPPGRLYMMGDNRDNSYDSRYWGPVDMDLVKGRAMFIYWSWDGTRRWPRWDRLLRLIR
jgi:signal peptidase I